MALKLKSSVKEVEEECEPVSPTGQYFNSSSLSMIILGVFESEVPIDDSQTMTMTENVFLPVSPRFSSIMVRDENGVAYWRRVKVKIEDHIKKPVFPAGLSIESYSILVDEYLTKIATEQLPQSRPLWEIHVIKYPTRNAAGMMVIKLHHAMGDGFSLMGAIFSCVKRADDPSLPLSFPSQSPPDHGRKTNIFRRVPQLFSVFFNTATDFAWTLLQSSFVEDDKSPIRSGEDGVEFRPIEISTVTFDLDHIREIKSKLGATVNDVISGVVFYGIRLYMESISSPGYSETARITAIMLLNTRMLFGYQSLQEMTRKRGTNSSWGNQVGWFNVPLTPCMDAEKTDPLKFVYEAKKLIKKKRNSLAVYLTGRLLEMIRRFGGPEAAAKQMHRSIKNASLSISNLIGPMEKMVIADHPCKGLYFMVFGVPQSLMITLLSYNGKIRMAFGTERGFINSQLLVSCIEKALERISQAALAKPIGSCDQ